MAHHKTRAFFIKLKISIFWGDIYNLIQNITLKDWLNAKGVWAESYRNEGARSRHVSVHECVQDNAKVAEFESW